MPSTAFAQQPEQSSFFVDFTKGIVFDPTTYAPAMITYDATMRDWNSSQPFFRLGYKERNRRFTLSGRPDDTPIGYNEGRNLILKDALGILQVSLVNNATSRIIDRVLIARYPEHRTLFRTLGWIERVGFASFMSYRLSANHFRQAQLNEQRARELGMR
jgi:hypothetical protein